MAQTIAVRNLPTVENATALWEKHNIPVDPLGLPEDGCACLVAILAIDKGFDRDVYEGGMYQFVADNYDIPRKDVDAIEGGFMGCGRERNMTVEYYEYGKFIRERVGL